VSGLTPTAEQVAQCLSSKTGLDLNVVRAWIAIESAWGKSPTDHYNYLNLKSSHGNTFATFTSPADACDAYYSNLQGPDYSGIRAAATSNNVVKQLQAITDSPWDEGHYGGNGSSLVSTYNAVAKTYGGGGLVGGLTGYLKGGIPGAISGAKGTQPGTPVKAGFHAPPGTILGFPLGLYLQVVAGGFILLVAFIVILAAIGLRAGAGEAAVTRLPVAGSAVKAARRRQGARRTQKRERAITEEQAVRAQARGAAYRGEEGNPMVFEGAA
jgi:hypothetical protein